MEAPNEALYPPRPMTLVYDGLPTLGERRVFLATWRGREAEYVLDARALTIREAQKETQKETELLWQLVRGIALVISPQKGGSVYTSVWVAYADGPGPEPRVVPLNVDLDDPPTAALIGALKETPHWRGQGPALAMGPALGVSNKKAYLVAGAILVLVTLLVLGAAVVMTLASL